MRIIPFDPEHVRQMRLQEHHHLQISHLSDEYLTALGNSGPAASAEVNGRVIACGGVAALRFGVGTLWAFLAEDSGRQFIRIHREAQRFIAQVGLRRVEASAEIAFRSGCRWLELLGFEREGVMRKYGPDGADHVLYSKVLS